MSQKTEFVCPVNKQGEYLSFLQGLDACGIGLTASDPLWGCFTLTPEEAVRYAANPMAFLGARHGVTAEQFRNYLASERQLKCSVRSVRGKPCKGHVQGCYELSVEEWCELEAHALCIKHAREAK